MIRLVIVLVHHLRVYRVDVDCSNFDAFAGFSLRNSKVSVVGGEIKASERVAIHHLQGIIY